MFSRGELLVQMTREKSQTDDVSSSRINLTLQGSKIVSGPVWSDRRDRPPDITCYESDISDTEITQATTPVIEEHLHIHFLRESDIVLDSVSAFNKDAPPPPPPPSHFRYNKQIQYFTKILGIHAKPTFFEC